MEIKKFEAYKFDDENYEDFGQEHAKVLIAKFIDRQNDGNYTMEDALKEVTEEYDLLGASGGTNELVEAVVYSAKVYLDQLSGMVNEL